MSAPAQAVAVRERPILMSGPMVKAILSGSKTQTRRVIKPQPTRGDRVARIALMPPKADVRHEELWWAHGGDLVEPVRGIWLSPGLRLWVRETWKENIPPSGWIYRATDEAGCDWRDERPWRPSIFMPREASRLTLEVTEVRVQRLQEISAVDVRHETGEWLTGPVVGSQHVGDENARGSFMKLWDSINGKRAPRRRDDEGRLLPRGQTYAWASNPWVWAISFRRLP